MEVDPSPSDDQPSQAPKFALNLVSLIKTEQGQNGVKHGDYKRYRQHCKNKLRVLYKKLKFQHGRTKYVKRKIEAATVTDIRHLHILIFSAERAWAYAMDFKKQIEGSMNLQKRRHLAARMRKAACWARDLARIAAVRCDPRGVVEAEAYAAFLSGSALVEKQQQWDTALARLTRARHIFSTLSSFGGTPEQQALYLQQVEEVEPALRFCRYQLTKQGGQQPEPSEAQLLATAQQEEGVLPAPQLQAHLSTLSAEGGGALPGGPVQADVAVNLTWLGRPLPVRGERLKAAVLQVQSLEGQLSGAMEVDGPNDAATSRQGALYEKLLRALQDARTAAKQAINSSSAPEGDTAHAELVAVEAALGGMVATRKVEHAELQARDLEERFARGLDKARKDTKREASSVSAEEVVRVLDLLSRALAELADVGAHGGGRAGEQLYEAATGKSTCVRAARTYYTAHHLLGAGKPLEAYALFQRAAQRAGAAADEAPDAAYKAYCSKLSGDADKFMSVAHAEHAASVAGQREGVESGLGGLGLSDTATPPTHWLLSALDSWESFAPAGKAPRVYQLPFSMQPVPCRPIMLDTAAAHVVYPSLEHRLKRAEPEKRSVLSSLWGWGAKK